MRNTAQNGDTGREPSEVTTEAQPPSAPDSERSDARSAPRLADSSDPSARPDRGHPAETSSESPQPRAAERELGFEDAERFAASFRPSWAPDAPPTPTLPPAPFVGAAGGTARVVRHSTRNDLRAPKLRKQRGSAYAVLGGSILAVAGLVYLAIASSSVRRGGEHAGATKAPAETRVQAVQAAPAEAPAPPAADPAPPPAAADLAPVDPQEPPADPVAPVEATAQPGADAPLAAEPPAVDLPATPLPGAETTAAAPPAEPPAADLPAAPRPGAETAAAAPAPQPRAAHEQPSAADAVPELKEPEAAAAAAATPEPPAAAPAAAQEPEPAPERPKQVLLRLAANPPHARLKLDGQPIENPFRGHLPRSSKHRIEARAPGYLPEIHILRMEADVRLTITLKREPRIDIKPNPHREPRPGAQAPSSSRPRGAGFVTENPY